MPQFKYRGRPEIGLYLGKLYGYELIQEKRFQEIDVIIPVPLHQKILRKHGYNQSEKFAEGLTQAMQKELDTTTLIRTCASETQTRKARFSRWENVKEIFSVADHQKILYRHILLVDDVITTGATIEACASQLLQHEGTRVSVASLARTLR